MHIVQSAARSIQSLLNPKNITAFVRNRYCEFFGNFLLRNLHVILYRLIPGLTHGCYHIPVVMCVAVNCYQSVVMSVCYYVTLVRITMEGPVSLCYFRTLSTLSGYRHGNMLL